MDKEEWSCGKCGHTETADIDKMAGKTITKETGRKTIQTTVCPHCRSEDWHSECVRRALP